MSKERIVIRTVVSIIIAAVAFVMILKQSKTSMPQMSLHDRSEYAVIYDEHIPSTKIGRKDWFVANGKIYVLFEDCSYLNIYSTAGDFLYSLQFFHSRNGLMQIGYKDDMLLVRTRKDDVFFFDGIDEVEYIQSDRNNRIVEKRLTDIDHYLDYDFHNEKISHEAGYYMENNTIYHVTDLGEKKPIVYLTL